MEQDKVFGIVKELTRLTLTISTRDDREIIYEIKEPWIQFVPFLKVYDEVFIQSPPNTTVLDQSSLLVIEPRYLVSVTETIKGINCPRKVYVKHMGASSSYDPMLHQMQIKGNLLHDVFTNKLVHEQDITDAIDQTIEQNRVDLILADFDDQTARSYLNQDAMVLKAFPITGQSEIDVKHYGYGLIGKLDALTSSDMIIELKSSRIPDAHPQPDHNIQMNVYQEMVSDYLQNKPKGKVLYVSDGKFGLKDPTNYPHQKTIISRNYAYLVLTGKYLPPVLRGEDKRYCKRCYRKEGCMSLCAGLKHQRDCDACYHDNICAKEAWGDEKELFFKTQTAATIFEEQEEKAQEYFGHRESFQSTDAIDTLPAKKSDHTTDYRGFFLTEFDIEQNETSFRQGDYVTVYPIEHKEVVEMSYNAIIVDISSDGCLLQSTNTLPHEIEIYPSTTSTLLRRSRENLYRAMISPTSIIQLVIALLDPTKQEKTVNTLDPLGTSVDPFTNPLMDYNTLQRDAIRQALATPDFLLIQGPAGTGKTSVIVEIINQLVHQGKSVLVSAFTNMAVDNVGLNLSKTEINFIRLGSSSRVTPELKQYTIEQKTDEFKEFTQNRKGKVILATTTTIGRSQFEDLYFDYVLIDEASQMTLPNTLMPILHGEKFVLVGDHAQLPPIVISDDALDLQYDHSLFEKLSVVDSRFIMLQEQYRMSDQILSFPNNRFYDGKLRSANQQVADQSLQYSSELITPQSFQLVAIEESDHSPVNQSNYDEAILVVHLIYQLLNKVQLQPNQIGVITPFRAQVALLRQLLPDIKVDTIDRFQGSEADVIVFSTVTMADIPLLSDHRRINVALTRAKQKLIVIQTNPSRQREATMLRELYRDAFRRGYYTHIDNTQLDQLEQDLERFVTQMGKTFQKPEIRDIGTFSNRDIIFYNSIAMLPVQLDTSERCLICYQMTKIGIQCPGCGYVYHERQLMEWVEMRDKCPTCKHRLRIVKT